MEKRILLVLLAVVLVVSLVAFAACAKEEEEPGVWQWPEKLALLTTTGLGQAAAIGYSSPLAADTGMAIRCVPEDKTMLQYKWVAEGRFFSISQGNVPTIAYIEATKGYAARDTGPFQVRLLWSYNVSNLSFLVRGDSDIKTVYDIKPGTKFVDWVFAPACRRNYNALLAWAQVDPEDIIWVPASNPAVAHRFITGGQADVSWSIVAAPFVMEAAAAPHGIRFIPLNAEEDPEGAKRFLEVAPTFSFGVMSHTPEAMGVWGLVGVCPTLTRADSDPELVYHYAKWMDENYDLYKDNHALNKNMTLDNLMKIVATSYVPAHEGLVRYLTELGKWTPAHDARQAQNIELLTRYVDAYQEAIAMADDQGIEVHPENEEWMELWENHKQKLGLPRFTLFLGLEE